MARAFSRGLVWRKPDVKLQADEQEHPMRRTLDVGWLKTTKPCVLTVIVNDAAVQRKFMLLSGELHLTSVR
jgi:hypothetical protein